MSHLRSIDVPKNALAAGRLRASDLLLPDMIFQRPDGSEFGRLRYGESDDEPPHYRSRLAHDASAAQEAELKRHLAGRIFPVMRRRFRYDLWMALAR